MISLICASFIIASANSYKLTIIYDNYQAKPSFTYGWGFSLLIETPQKTILFDTGESATRLAKNLSLLDKKPTDIDAVVISHIHHDHTGGLAWLVSAHPGIEVYIPASFPESFKQSLKNASAKPIEVKDFQKIFPEIFSTGEFPGAIPEQALVLKSKQGLIIITGCAHPGIVRMLKEVKKHFPKDKIYLVIGGFHLFGRSEKELEDIIQEFKEFGVEKVCPCHCSGEKARRLFEKAYGKDYLAGGAGFSFTIK